MRRATRPIPESLNDELRAESSLQCHTIVPESGEEFVVAIGVVMVTNESERARRFDVGQQVVDKECRRRVEAKLFTGNVKDPPPGLGRSDFETVNPAGKVPKERVTSEDVIAMDVARVAEQVERVCAVQFLDGLDHWFVWLEDIFPSGDEIRFRSAEAQDIEGAAQESSPINLSVFICDLDAVEVHEDLRGFRKLRLRGDRMQSEREIKAEQDVADIEKKSADHLESVRGVGWWRKTDLEVRWPARPRLRGRRLVNRRL